jgi:tRNA threonylcarbamoyladenosine biosynthesis protein TsaB
MPASQALKTLSIDTSSPRGSVALLAGSEVTAELRLLSQETHSARLLAALDYLLKSVGWSLEALDLIAVGIGPGSFTGIRIGVSTALGLAQSRGCAFAGISGLDALAHEFPRPAGRVGIVMDAQRSQVYYAEYHGLRGKLRFAGKPALWFPQALAKKLGRKKISLAGDGAIRYAKELRISSRGRRRLVEVELFLARAIGRLALERRRSWHSGEFLTVEPLYIRPPDAVIKRIATR